jgi:hemerythrin-like domain-containing protein
MFVDAGRLRHRRRAMDGNTKARPNDGPGKADFDDPIGLLLKCHERIELQLVVLERATTVLRSGSDDDVRLAFAPVDAAVGHFAVTGARHTEDEEESLFPRLRSRGGALPPALAEALDVLEGEHDRAEALHEELTRVVAGMRRDGARIDAQVEQFCDCVSALLDVYRPHMRLENEVVIPAAGSILTSDELAAVGAEMRARREVTRIGLGRRAR